MADLHVIDDSPGLSDVPGFEAAGVACDIRNRNDSRLDLAVIHTSAPAAVAGVFTQNAIQAAPVLYCREIVRAGTGVHGVVVNSGNANACTGGQGAADSRRMAELAAEAAGNEPGEFLVCSTGRIGEPLPMDRVEKGILRACSCLTASSEAGRNAAQAILTSDTRPKTVTVSFTCSGTKITVAGMAKGAGMIQPDMATMLAFLATDAEARPSFLQTVLSGAVGESFNCITVDGDTSTNDTVLLLANGVSGKQVDADNEMREAFIKAVQKVCFMLAEKIVSDGEKISKVVELRVTGAANQRDAEKVARAIGNSLLVKSSWYGEDPNWGRLLDAAGYAGAALSEEKLSLSYNDVPVFLSGAPRTENKRLWKEIVKNRRFTIHLDLGLGSGEIRFLATDLTEAYVNFNKSE